MCLCLVFTFVSTRYIHCLSFVTGTCHNCCVIYVTLWLVGVTWPTTPAINSRNSPDHYRDLLSVLIIYRIAMFIFDTLIALCVITMGASVVSRYLIISGHDVD